MTRSFGPDKAEIGWAIVALIVVGVIIFAAIAWGAGIIGMCP